MRAEIHHFLLHACASALCAALALLQGVPAAAIALAVPVLLRGCLVAAPRWRRWPASVPWVGMEATWLVAVACALPAVALLAVFACALAAAAALAGPRGLLAAAGGATLVMALQVTWWPPWPLLPNGEPVALALAALLVAGFAAALGLLAWRRAVDLRAALAAARSQGERLRRASQHLGRYLSPQLCRRVLDGELAPGAGSRRRWLSICFADIQGFTRLSDTVAPEVLTGVLNDYQQAMAAEVQAHGGTLDKFMGDGVLVLFGDPDSRGRAADALACVEMARAMHHRLEALVTRWRADGLVDALAMRTGVHSGWCTVGDFGGQAGLCYTAIGASVNLASRLEQAAAPGQVLMSRATWALVRDRVACRSAGQVRLRGIDQAVPTWELDGGDALPLVLEGPGASLTLAVDADLGRLSGWLEHTATRLRRHQPEATPDAGGCTIPARPARVERADGRIDQRHTPGGLAGH